MTILSKTKSYTIIPGVSGTSAIPGITGVPGTPPYCTEVQSIGQKCYTNPTCSSSFSSSSLQIGYTPSGCNPPLICNTVTVYSTECYPAVSGTPGTTGTPGIPATPGQLLEYLNEGWNSWSRSIDKFTLGSYFSYYVDEGVRGVLLSIGVYGKSEDNINTFSHSIMVEPSGIVIFEDGVEIKTIRHSYSSASKIRLYRQSDNTVICLVTTGTETLIHIFTDVAYDIESVPLYVYCHMYIADDTLSGAEFKTGEVSFGAA